jgi:hypothetical protein
MNCQKFETMASELARGQMMEVDVRDEALAHSADCSTCATQLRDEEMLSRGLRSLAAEMNSFEGPATLETNLLSAFRQQQVVVPMPVRKDYRRYWLVAVAALILIVFSVVAVRISSDREVPAQRQANGGQQGLQPQKEDPKQQFAQDNGSKRDAPESLVPQHKQRRQPSFRPELVQARAGRSRNEPRDSNHVSKEVATEFMPLGYLNAESVQDGGQIVRVELPRSALVKFGLPVNVERSNERVKADILVGIDGMAHAIRFVQDRRVQ